MLSSFAEPTGEILEDVLSEESFDAIYGFLGTSLHKRPSKEMLNRMLDRVGHMESARTTIKVLSAGMFDTLFDLNWFRNS